MKTTIINHSDKRRAFRHDGGLAAIGPNESRDLIGLKLSAKTRATLEVEGWEFECDGGALVPEGLEPPRGVVGPNEFVMNARQMDALKAKADELGITYASNIGEATLSARIDAAAAAQAAPESENEAE